MPIRKAVLILDKNGNTADEVKQELRTRGYHAVCVEEAEVSLYLLDSMDRIYTILIVDEFLSIETLKDNIRILKNLGAGVPIVVTVGENDPLKEKTVRKEGVFFYHVMGAGMNELVRALIAAVDVAERKEKFIPGLKDQQVLMNNIFEREPW